MADNKMPSLKRCELSSAIIIIRGRLFTDASKHVAVLTIYKNIVYIYIYIL